MNETEQDLAYRKERDAQIALERQRTDIKLAYHRDRADLFTAYNRDLAAAQDDYLAERLSMMEYQAKKEAITAAHEAKFLPLKQAFEANIQTLMGGKL